MPKELKNKTTHLDFKTGELNLPDRNDLIEISESLKKILNKNPDEIKKQKTTYSISPVANLLIKEFAEECDVTQGGIVELAPLLFRVIASESLVRREKGLSSIRIISDQILSNLGSIEKIAPHLSAQLNYIKECIKELLQLESSAIEEKNYKGIDEVKMKFLSKVGSQKNEIAFHKDVQKILSRDENIEKIFKSMK